MIIKNLDYIGIGYNTKNGHFYYEYTDNNGKYKSNIIFYAKHLKTDEKIYYIEIGRKNKRFYYLNEEETAELKRNIIFFGCDVGEAI